MRKHQNELWWAAFLLLFTSTSNILSADVRCERWDPIEDVLMKPGRDNQHVRAQPCDWSITTEKDQHRILQRNLDIKGHDRQAALPSARVCLSLICHDCSMTISIQETLLIADSSSFFLIKDHNSELHSCSDVGIQLWSRIALKMWTSFCSGRLVCVVILAAAMLVSPSAGNTPTICMTEMWLLRAFLWHVWPWLAIKYHIWKIKYNKEPPCPPFLTFFPLSEEEWCSTVVKTVFHPGDSQLLLQTRTFQLLDYPAVQKSASRSGRKSKLAMNRSHEWAANCMPSGKGDSDPDSSLTWCNTFKVTMLCLSGL